MADITSVSGQFNPQDLLASTKAKAAKNDDIFSSASFLRLLGAQMKSQNPLDPMKDTEFVAQMAQFSQLEQITSLSANMKSLNMSSQISQGAALIGREVTYVPEGSITPVTGRVDKMVLENGGTSSALIVNGVRVGINLVLRQSYLTSGAATSAFVVFAVFYVLAAVTTWAVYLRVPRSAVESPGADAGSPVAGSAKVSERLG